MSDFDTVVSVNGHVRLFQCTKNLKTRGFEVYYRHQIENDFPNLERDHALGRPETKSLSQLRRPTSGLAAVSDRRGRGARCDGSRMGDPVFARRVQRPPVGMRESGRSVPPVRSRGQAPRYPK